jgi:formylglycine-generating enzyme required for sulfatase activity
VTDLIGGGATQTPHQIANFAGKSPILLRTSKVIVKDRPKSEPVKEKIVKEIAGKLITNSIGMILVRIPAGKFTMGSPKDETGRNNDEKQHGVEITRDFYLGVYEVTQKQFKDVMGYNPSHFSRDGSKAKNGDYFVFTPPAGGKDKLQGVSDADLGNFPVENVSWKDAQAFLDAMNARAEEKSKGHRYRLPSEEEWEYACRGGPRSSSKPFHFKTPSDSLGVGQANFDASHAYGKGMKGARLERTNVVGKNGEPNALGLYDMHGNVWEWCADWHNKSKVGKTPPRDGFGPLPVAGRVLRGGAWASHARECRSAHRANNEPDTRHNYLGFRVALVPSK